MSALRLVDRIQDLSDFSVTAGMDSDGILIYSHNTNIFSVGPLAAAHSGVALVSATVPGGFSVNVVNPTTTAAINITTDLSGVVKGDGSSLLAATPGTDYVSPTDAYVNPSWLTSISAAIVSGNFTESKITNLTTDLTARPTGILLTVPSSIYNNPVNYTVLNGMASGNLSLINQSPNYVWAGPPSGSATIPTFRTLISGDIPTISEAQVSGLAGDLSNRLTAVTLTVPSSIYNNPINFNVSSGTASGNLSPLSQSSGLIYASPANTSGIPTFRVLAASDIPNISESQVTGLTTDLTARPTGILLTTNGVIYTSPISFTMSSNFASGNLVLATQTAKTFLGGPTSGSAATPTFRLLASGDMPSTINVNTISSATASTPVRFDAYYGQLFSDTYGATTTFDMSVSNLHTVTLTGNTTVAFSNDQNGQKFTLVFVQDGSGSRTITAWPGGIRWPAGTAPTLTTTANKADIFVLMKVSSGNYYGLTAGQNL